MMRLIVLLLLIGAVGGGAYLTKPTETDMKAKADAAFAKVRKEQAKDLDLGALAKGAVDGLTRKAKYEDLKVAAHYTVMDGEKEVLSCWGAYTKIMCPALKEAK
jgi:hypothetical protein